MCFKHGPLVWRFLFPYTVQENLSRVNKAEESTGGCPSPGYVTIDSPAKGDAGAADSVSKAPAEASTVPRAPPASASASSESESELESASASASASVLASASASVSACESQSESESKSESESASALASASAPASAPAPASALASSSAPPSVLGPRGGGTSVLGGGRGLLPPRPSSTRRQAAFSIGAAPTM